MSEYAANAVNTGENQQSAMNEQCAAIRDAAETEYAAGLAVLLDANGLTHEDLGNSHMPVLELEMFLQDYPKMVGLHHFRSLVTLKLMQQGIQRIEGLQQCTSLQKLWLIENKIRLMEGLSACTGLQELYLYSNRITNIAGLEQLQSLQVLWLADNYISSLTGISHLQMLRELHLARNDIRIIGDSLLANTALTSVNLADNHISSFQDVACLAKLPQLKELCLADPFWGECPVAELCNYQTFALYLLPQLSSLDTLVLAEETKAAAAATFTKKQLYYNMRIRTLRRAAADLMSQAQAGCQAAGSMWSQLHRQLACTAKGLQRHSRHAQLKSADEQQLVQVQSCLQQLVERRSALDRQLVCDSSSATSLLESAVWRLHLELGSGGNIRMEEARPADAWATACQDLLRSRFLAAGEPGGIEGFADVQVLSIARIHNRHVRLQFEKFLSAASTDEAASKQCMDYLFFGEHPALPGELMHVVQHGFRSCTDYAARGLDEAVRLTNCISIADQLRMQQAANAQLAAGKTTASSSNNSNSEGRSGTRSSTRQVQLLVCKVCLPAVAKELPGHVLVSPTGLTKIYSRDGQVRAASCLDGTRVLAHQHPGALAVYRTVSKQGCKSSGDQVLPQHRAWYVFNHAAVLPEYLVTIQCSSQPTAGSLASGWQGAAPGLDPLLRLCSQSLSTWLSEPAAGGSMDQDDQRLQQDCQAALSGAAAAAATQLQLAVMTPAALVGFTGSSQLSSLTYLSLHNCGLSSCGGLLSMVPCLAELVLSFNRLSSLDSLLQADSHDTTAHEHGSLTSLDVSYNSLRVWQPNWLAGLSKLTKLDASCNQLAELQLLSHLGRCVPPLLDLDLLGNPVQQHKAYQLSVRSTLNRLQQLDGQQLSCQALDDGALSAALVRSGATMWHSQAGPVQELPTSGPGDWRLQLHSVVLEHKALQSLVGIAFARNVVCLNLADNLLTAVSGLEASRQLRELNLSNNLLTQVQQLSGIVSLRQLDISHNHLSTLLPLSTLTGVSQLSVENNRIASLGGATAMRGLLELYAANNDINELKEPERLSVLPRLVILDLAGNPVASAEDYRLLLLYRLRHLKVLDGRLAEASELTAARAKYSGRLTMSFLEEQLGSSCALSAIRSLDLSNLRIRDVGPVFASGCPFTSLAELVLDNNNISSWASLGGLQGLSVLRLSGNRLCDADPLDPGFAALGTAARSSTFLPSLQALHVANNGLTSLAPLQLQLFPALRSLFVQGNDLQRLDGLEGLQQLVELVADKNKIRCLDADALSSLVRLRELHLQDNLIRSLAGSSGSSTLCAPGSSGARASSLGGCLPNLLLLNLAGNRLAEVNDLDRLSSCSSLLEVSLAGNPIARKQVHMPWLLSRCPRLQVIDHQQVTSEDQACASAMFGQAPWDCTNMADTAAGLLAAVDNRTGCGAMATAARPGLTPAMVMPAVINQDACPQLAASLAWQAAAGISTPQQLVISVPSIQSGVLVLSGSAAFGLEGTSIYGKSVPAAAIGSRQRPASGNRSPAPSNNNAAAISAVAQPAALLQQTSGGRRAYGQAGLNPFPARQAGYYRGAL